MTQSEETGVTSVASDPQKMSVLIIALTIDVSTKR